MAAKYNPFYRFVCAFAIVFIVVSSCLIGFNFLVDPFSNFHSLHIKNFNAVRHVPDVMIANSRFYKSLQIAHSKPKVVVLGSSRVMAGINPDDLSEMLQEKAVYNAGFHGARFDEIYDFFCHSLYHQPQLKMVFIGIDIFAFQTQRSHHSDGHYNIRTSPYSINNLQIALFSKTGLLASYKTVKENYMHRPFPYFSENGHQLSGNQAELNPITQMGEISYLKNLFTSKEYYKDYTIDPHHLQLFEDLVKECKARNIQLHVFINPSKAIYWEAFHLSNIWEKVEDLKAKLCAIHPLWDFSGYNPITTETFAKHCYDDCSHYSSNIGKHLIAKILGQESFDVGYFLTPENVQLVNKQIRQDRESWGLSHK